MNRKMDRKTDAEMFPKHHHIRVFLTSNQSDTHIQRKRSTNELKDG